jgi:hypothetical protein
LGAGAGNLLTTGSGNIDIASQGVAGESATIRIGTTNFESKTFIAGIRGVTTGHADAIPVVIDSFGQLGTINSSRRFKKEIKPLSSGEQRVSLIGKIILLLESLTLLVGHFRAGDCYAYTGTINELLVGEL